jgi:hypothetical protein
VKINKKAWEDFDTYDISDIPRAIDYWDDFCGKLDLDKISQDLRLLDRKAEALQNQSTRIIPDDEEIIGDLAEEIELAIDSLMEELEKIRAIVDPLTNLIPDPDEEDDEGAEENQDNKDHAED